MGSHDCRIDQSEWSCFIRSKAGDDAIAVEPCRALLAREKCNLPYRIAGFGYVVKRFSSGRCSPEDLALPKCRFSGRI